MGIIGWSITTNSYAWKYILGGDLNGHVGVECVLEFAKAYDLALTNTFFNKREELLIIFKSGENKTQIDYCLLRRRDLDICKDCKVIPGESLTNKHRLLVIDLAIKGFKYRKEKIGGRI